MSQTDYAICLLAGGLARRMGGGDKGEINIGGKTLLASLIERFQDAPYLFLNANGDGARFAHYGLEVVPDILPDHQGPLSGIYSAMRHIKENRPNCQWLAVLPTDAPLIPATIATDMMTAAIAHQTDLVSVKSAGRTHPVIGLWSLRVFAALEEALIEEGVRKIDAFTEAVGCHYLDYEGTPDPFLNLNRPDDLAAYHATISA